MNGLLLILRRTKRFLSFKRFRQLTYILWIKYGARFFGSRFYGNWFYKAIESDNKKSHPVIAKALVSSLHPNNVVDFGCGDGWLLSEFAKKGVSGIGYEFSRAGLRGCQERGVLAKELDFRKHTLLSPLPEGDLVVCLEVAEHLQPQHADFLCDLLSRCEDSKWLVFSAATPGQGGEGHYNEQPHSYWRTKIEQHGWRFNNDLTEKQRAVWREGGAAFYYWQNLLVFEWNVTKKSRPLHNYDFQQ